MSVNKERVQQLVDALRSGDYSQTRGVLQRLDGSNCCLGVACRVAGIEAKLDPFYKKQVLFDSNLTILPETVRKYYGFNLRDPLVDIPPHIQNKYPDLKRDELKFASVLNDSYQLSFSEIADCFEYTFLKDLAKDHSELGYWG